MSNFQLDKRLAESSSIINDLGDVEVRLSNNALVPWVLLVPKVGVIEWFELNERMQIRLNKLINKLSVFLRHELKVDKVNIATIGNVVSQMHIHVIGRKKNDFCWPDVVWGEMAYEEYDALKKENLLFKIRSCLLEKND